MPDFIVNGHAIHLEQHGAENRPAVILLHHGLGSVQAWREQVPALLGAGYQVVVYDRWGYGRSAPRPALDLPTFAADVADLQGLLSQLAIPRAALVGHSDGGTLALYYAAQHPEQVACLVTIAAHIYVESSIPVGIQAVEQDFAGNTRLRAGLRRVHGQQFEHVFQNWYGGWRGLEDLDWDMRPTLAKIICPALVVQGTLDEHATPQHARDIADHIVGAELWLLEGARHMLPQENALEFNRVLISFLKRAYV